MFILVKIKNKKAKKILDGLASLNLIEIREKPGKNVMPRKTRILTHFASEVSLAKTWNDLLEDRAWENL